MFRAPRPGGPSGRQGSTPMLTEPESKVYNFIKSRGDMGAWTAEIRSDTNIPDNMLKKVIKNLTNKNLIKDVVNYRNKTRKMYMAVEFEPSKEITGGSWYSNGSLDIEFITVLRDHCRIFIQQKGGTATVEDISNSISNSQVFTMSISTQQVMDILGAMVLDKEIEDCVSTGFGEFSSVTKGRKCYRVPTRGKAAAGAAAGVFATMPCGVCPRIRECTPDGIISPDNCVYYNKWLESLEF